MSLADLTKNLEISQLQRALIRGVGPVWDIFLRIRNVQTIRPSPNAGEIEVLYILIIVAA